ncbi:MAG: S-layer homology domain-containing protein [Caulobacteraceae bacterium]
MKRIISIVVTGAFIYSSLFGSVCAEAGSPGKFKDIKDSDWFAEAVGKMSAMEIIDGMPGGNFNPQGQVTRAQFIKMLVQAMEYKKVDAVSFTDLKPFLTSKPHWACVYIETALRNGVIVKDEIGDNFNPDVPITRIDMTMMMARALKLQPSTGENPFADMPEANGYATKLYEEYLIRGSLEGGKRLYKPEGLTTRAEAAVIISRMVEYKTDQEGYKSKMAAEDNYNSLVERIKAGNYTKDDLSQKSKMELAKQAADKEYIPEPIIKVEYNPNEYRYAKATLTNADDYSDDITFKRVCTNYADLNRSGGENYYGRYREVDMTRIITVKEAKSSFVEIPKRNAKLVNGKTLYYDFDFPTGKQLTYKIYITRSKTTKVIDIVLTVQ